VAEIIGKLKKAHSKKAFKDELVFLKKIFIETSPQINYFLRRLCGGFAAAR